VTGAAADDDEFEDPRGGHVECDSPAQRLSDDGFVRPVGSWSSADGAWAMAWDVIEEASRFDRVGEGLGELTRVGEFVLPPPNTAQRPFQALHIDFGLPIATTGPVDVARFTALYIPADRTNVVAATRIVLLRRFLAQRSWPNPRVVRDRLRQSARPGMSVEGILGRLLESVDQGRTLSAVDDPGFLCGMEFASLTNEYSYFSEHGLDLASVEQRIALGPGELLVFDNLKTAHGRIGTRASSELHQLCIGYAGLDLERQGTLIDRVLCAFVGTTP